MIEKNPIILRGLGYQPAHLHAALIRFGYVGAHLTGYPVTADSIDDDVLENLLYARTTELMRQVFAGFQRSLESGWSPAELEHLAEVALTTDHSEIQAIQLIRLAANGHLDEAITRARALLAAHPELGQLQRLGDLRGHLAYWLTVRGRAAEALEEYKVFCARHPDDLHARARMQALLEIKTREAEAHRAPS